MRTGDLRKRVTIQTRSSSKDSFGQQSQTWVDYLTCWAEITSLSGRELLAAQQVKSETTHEITIRYRPGITAAMRVMYQGVPYNVSAVLDEDMRHRFLQLLATEGLNQG